MKALKMTAAAFLLAMFTAVTAQAGTLLDDQHPHSDFAFGGAAEYEMEGTMERESN